MVIRTRTGFWVQSQYAASKEYEMRGWTEGRCETDALRRDITRSRMYRRYKNMNNSIHQNPHCDHSGAVLLVSSEEPSHLYDSGAPIVTLAVYLS